MVRHKISRVLVMDAGKLTGILTKKDIGYRSAAGGGMAKAPGRPDPGGRVCDTRPGRRRARYLAKAIAGIFMEKNIGGVPVVDHGTVTGIVTKSDLMKSALVTGLQGTVQDVMEDAETVNRWHSLAHVIALMKERDKKLVVTSNDGSVAGIITETNLAFHDEDRRRSGGINNEEPGKRYEHPCRERTGCNRRISR